jgi:hypothetical protein
MAEPVACLAPDLRLARASSKQIAARLPRAALWPASISGYLARPRAPRRIVLCAAGRSPEDDLEFLRRAARCLLWPAPPEDFQDAIGGLRTEGARPRRAASSEALSGITGLPTALLLEGQVGPGRARAALKSSTARHWIVESPRHVRIPERLRRALGRAGVRWTALEPIEVVALYLSPRLAKRRDAWKRFVPGKTPVWVRESEIGNRKSKRRQRVDSRFPVTDSRPFSTRSPR